MTNPGIPGATSTNKQMLATASDCFTPLIAEQHVLCYRCVLSAFLLVLIIFYYLFLRLSTIKIIYINGCLMKY